MKKTETVKIEFDAGWPEIEYLSCVVGKNKARALFRKTKKEDVWHLCKISDIEYLDQILANLKYYGVVPEVKIF